MTIPTPVEFWTLDGTRVGAVAGKVLTSGDGNDYYVDPGKIGQGWQGNNTAGRRLAIADAAVNCLNGSWSASMWVLHKIGMFTSDVLSFRTAAGVKFAIQCRSVDLRLFKGGALLKSVSRAADNTWVHIAVTYDATTGTGVFYVNNVPVDFATAPHVTNNDSPVTYLCGAPGTECSTSIDSVGVWVGSVLAASTIAKLYNSGNGWEYTPADHTPDAFAFAAVSDADPSTVYVSDSQEITGMDAGTAISITGGEYRLNGESWSSDPGTIDPGDTLELRGTSSAESEGVVTVTVTVGTLSVDWTITTGVLSSVVSNLIGSSILNSRIFRSRIVQGHV